MEFLLCEGEASKFAFVNKPGPRPLHGSLALLAIYNNWTAKNIFVKM